MYDVMIIGAGIIGSFLARDLSRYNLKICLLDKESDVANATTMANSAIVHTGYDPEEGTLKAKLNVVGARMYRKICEELGAGYLECGALVVACSEEEVEGLKELKRKADLRGIKAEILDREALLEMEPNLSEHVGAGMDVPETAVVYPWEVANYLVEDAMNNHVELKLEEDVIAIEHQPEHFEITTSKGKYEARLVINSAGCNAQKIANMIGDNPFEITPRKGQYYVLSKLAKGFVNKIIYPTPTKLGKGVLAIPTTHGNILLGPNSELCELDDLATSKEGLNFMNENLTKIVQNVPYGEIIRSYAGIRACGNNNDFYIDFSDKYHNFIHLGAIDSPGMASAPAISRYVIDEFVAEAIRLEAKTEVVPFEKHIVMSKLGNEERNKYIKKNPQYGNIVCKCEKVSYQEIVDAIHCKNGARTIKGVKKRVRPGMGRCQGGFCEVEVAKILSKELGIPLTEVRYDQEDSKLGERMK